jgi:thymidylate synthase (FAD)
MTLDPRFAVATLQATRDPNRVIYAALHQDYSEGLVDSLPELSEQEAGHLALKRLLFGDRGHYGPLEHPQITLSVGNFPHSVMQQARTHRVGVSFDVQSMRYTGQRILDVVSGKMALQDAFYLRPAGHYSGRNGRRYTYTAEERGKDLHLCRLAAERYAELVGDGAAEEQARGILPFDYRQNFTVSFTLRAFLHFLDLRGKADAQLEIRAMAGLMLEELKFWSPEIADWYINTRWEKARLAP